MLRCRYLLPVLLSLGLFPGLLQAEGRCPPGYYPTGGGNSGWEACAPMGPISDESAESPPPETGPEWETRWGAIAIGKEGLGSAVDMSSEKQAKKIALSKCKASDTSDPSSCKLFTYHNQCAVIAWGQSGYVIQAGVDLQTASSIGMKKCSSKHQDCEIFYSNCTYPRRLN